MTHCLPPNQGSKERDAFEGSMSSAATSIRRLARELGSSFSVELSVPWADDDVPNVKKVKEFCVGLLENPVSHTWWPVVSRLGARERMTIAASLFLARKVLPSPPDPEQERKHAALLGRPAPDVPPGYLNFVRREVVKMFPVGWDHAYAQHVSHATVSISSCRENPRSKGGARFAVVSEPRRIMRQWLFGSELPEQHRVKYSEVRCDGKTRGVTISDRDHHALGPFHRTLYDHLSKADWLLRGEAREKCFSSFLRKRGEVFVSGDYESATDNLNLEVAEVILSTIIGRCRYTPKGLMEYALRTLRAKIEYSGAVVVDQLRGQLMGNFLSFPLLCVQNYLAFRFLVPDSSVPVKINGDDIVFRCRRSQYERWAEGVGRLGLSLSVGKTMVSSRFFSLNSTFFEGRRLGVGGIPIVRLTSVNRSSLPTGSSFVRFVRGWKGDSRRRLGGWYLHSHRRAIQATGRSVCELGIPADASQIHTAGLALREAFYRGSRPHLALPESPLPPLYSQSCPDTTTQWRSYRGRIRFSRKERREWRILHSEEVFESAWKPSLPLSRGGLDDRWWADAASSGFEGAWLAWRALSRRVKSMFGQRLPGVPLRAVSRPRRVAFWVPDSVFQDRCRSLHPGFGSL